MPPGLEPFPLTAAILSIVALIVFPVVRAYRESMEKRLSDKDAVIAQERVQRDEELKRTRAEHEREIDRMSQDLDRLITERDRFINLAIESAEASREATAATTRVVSVVEGRTGSRR